MRSIAVRLISLAGLGLLALAPFGSAPQAASPGRFVNWASHNGPSDESAYSGLTQVNRSNVGQLGLAWSLDLDDERMLEATPLAVDGSLYFTGSYAKVYAVDALTGKLKWSYDPEVWRHNPELFKFALPVNRGVAYAEGRVFVGTLDGRLIALDAASGRPLWSVQSTRPGGLQTITSAPRVVHGKVLIGQGGADFDERGYITAYDAATGAQAWRFYVAPGTAEQNRGDPAMERAAATWNGRTTGGGGGPWDSITVDDELNRIYVGTANPSPYDPEERSPGGGDNLYTDSIVALDADTGKYLWHYQVNPRDAWDYDSTQQMTLADLVIDGKPRKVLMQAPKNGFFYVLDRTTGRLISAGKIGKATWAERIDPVSGRPVEAGNIRYETGESVIWPAPIGAHSWQSMAFNPQAGLVYIPYMQLGMRYTKVRAQAGGASFGGLSMSMVHSDPHDGKGALVAWDPVAQKVRWRIAHDTLWNGGVLTTAGGLVVQGAADGYLTIYDAATGERLWRFNAGLGIISAPISYAVDGRQYVSVLVGYGATNVLGDIMNAGWKYAAQPRRLLTFSLGGTAALPPTAPPDRTVHAVDDPALKLEPADVKAGEMLFIARCANCHGLNAVSAGAPAPDLRESQVALSREALWSIVHDGSLLPRGMPRFAQLSPAEVGQIHAYIRATARQALAVRPAS